MRRLKLALLGSVFIIAACGQKPTPQPSQEVAPLSVEVQPQAAPTETTSRTTEEAKPQVPPAQPGVEEAKPGAIAPPAPQPKTITVSMGSLGFSPAEVTIKKGDTVVFKNTGTDAMWPASAVHPSHDVYPEKGGCLGSKFDACKGVKAGESWSFTFNSVGSWGYHDHLSPALRGKIAVE